MEDSDTATIELTRNEAQEVINALSNYQFEVSGREEEQVLNVRELLKREFGFEEPDFQGTDFSDENAFPEGFANLFESDEGQEIRLSRTEAEEVARALADVQEKSGSTETIKNVRARVLAAFDLSPGATN